MFWIYLRRLLNFPGVVSYPQKADVLYSEDWNAMLDYLNEVNDVNTMKPLFPPRNIDMSEAGPFTLGVVPAGQKMFITGMYLYFLPGYSVASRGHFTIENALGGTPIFPDLDYLAVGDSNVTLYFPMNSAPVALNAGDAVNVVIISPTDTPDMLIAVSLLGFTLAA